MRKSVNDIFDEFIFTFQMQTIFLTNGERSSTLHRELTCYLNSYLNCYKYKYKNDK